MRINSYQSARYTGVAQDYHCKDAPAELATQPLSPDSAYVVTPELAEMIARGPTGPGKCHDLDNFILCSTKTDFGLSPVLMTPEQRSNTPLPIRASKTATSLPGRTMASRRRDIRARARRHIQPGRNGAGTVYQDINGLEPGGTYTLSAWVSCSPPCDNPAHHLQPHRQHRRFVCRPFPASRLGRQVSLSFFVGGEGAVRIYLARGPGAGTVYWDDIHISSEKESR